MFWDFKPKFPNDGKYNFREFSYGDEGREFPPAFPSYVENLTHPLLYCSSLTHHEEGTTSISNKWSGSDGPREFRQNLKTMGPDWKYATKEIVYKVNSSGYRTREWKDIDWKESICLLGCSNTFGVGVNEDENLAYYIEKYTGRPVVNLGVPGGSNSLVAILCSLVLEKFPKPNAVVINWTPGDRYRHFFKNRYMDIGAWYAKEVSMIKEKVDNIDLTQAWETRYLDRYNELVENFYISKMVKIMCKDVKLVTLSYFDYMAYATRSDFHQEIDRAARDLIHPGNESHSAAALKIHKLLS